MLHHKNPKSFDLGFFAWAVQDENRAAVRFPACKIHSIGGVLSLAGVIYSAQQILLMYLSRVFYRFSDFLLEKGRIKLNPQQLWIFEKAI